jgi:hypothetical protein
VVKEGGVSLLPKGGISVNINALLSKGQFMAVPSADQVLNGVPVKVIKMLPLQDGGDLILSTLYIDEKALLVRRSVTTTRDNGTYEMDLQYGRYASLGLPDKVVLSFDTKDYKLPKGVTFEYDAGSKPPQQGASANQGKKGRVEIIYASYSVNKGLADALFK